MFEIQLHAGKKTLHTFNTISRLSCGISPCSTWASTVMALDVARRSASLFVSQKTMARPCEPLYTCNVLTMTDVRSVRGQPTAKCCNAPFSFDLYSTTAAINMEDMATRLSIIPTNSNLDIMNAIGDMNISRWLNLNSGCCAYCALADQIQFHNVTAQILASCSLNPARNGRWEQQSLWLIVRLTCHTSTHTSWLNY